LNHFSSPVWRVSWSISGSDLHPPVPSCFLSDPPPGMSLLSPLAMAKFHYGSKARTAFGGILTRSTILTEQQKHFQIEPFHLLDILISKIFAIFVNNKE
jgi:hypothetical protein